LYESFKNKMKSSCFWPGWTGGKISEAVEKILNCFRDMDMGFLSLLILALMLVTCDGALMSSRYVKSLKSFHQSNPGASPLFALPRHGSWRYLPLNPTRKPDVLTLFATRLHFIAVGSRSIHYEKFLPPASNLRLAKALLRKEAQLSEAITTSFNSHANIISAPVTAAASSVPKKMKVWLAVFRVVLTVIGKKVSDALAPLSKSNTKSSTVKEVFPILSMSQAKEWSMKKLKELEVAMTTVPAETASASSVAVTITPEHLGKAKASYWPATAKHQELLLAAKIDLATKLTTKLTESPSIESVVRHRQTEKRNYWVSRYW